MVCTLFFGFLTTAKAAEEIIPAPSHHAIPFKAENQSVGSDVFRVVLSLVVALGVGVGALYGVRRYLLKLRAVSADTRRVRTIETLRLTPRTTLFLIEFDERVLLLGQHGDAISVISEKHDAGASGLVEDKDKLST